ALAVGRGLDRVAFGAQQVRHDQSHAGFVFNQKDVGFHAGFVVVFAGSRTVKVAPCPCSLRTETVPPWASTISFTRLKPNPLPRICFSCAAAPRTKGLKISACSFSGIPGPRSPTRTSMIGS